VRVSPHPRPLPATLLRLRLRRAGGRGEARRFAICTLQLSNSPTHICRRASSPRVQFGHRASRPSCSFSPERERAERLAKNRFRGRPLARRASRTPFEKPTVHGQWFSPTGETVGPNRGLGSSFSPAFRTRMDLSACWMSQGLLLVPTRPVRADCRPDMHSSRPLPLPASAPSASWASRPSRHSGPVKVCGPPRPVPRSEDDRCALRIGTGRMR
jgi:hypothetical protein